MKIIPTCTFFLLQIITFPFRFLPPIWIHRIGEKIGTTAYYLLQKYRKRTLSNLALANALALPPEKIITIAKKSFQNLAITCLEYAKLKQIKKTKNYLICENPKVAFNLIKDGTGIVFFCGHQANWEVLFLEGTSRMPGIAIGKPIKNILLYQWITSIREKFGGKIIPPQNAIKEGIKSLREGKFLGIVGDQGMPESSYSYPFLGRKAWTSPIPAILAYKAKCPLIAATLHRRQGKYFIHYSEPIWPHLDTPLEKETARMMNAVLSVLEDSIKKNPGEWLWQHNRWKQETPKNVYYRFRWDSILIILPQEEKQFIRLLPHLTTFRSIYPRAFLSFLVPYKWHNQISINNAKIIPYSCNRDLFIQDYRFKLVFNFSPIQKLSKHFLRLSAFEVINEKKLLRLAKAHLSPHDDLSLLLKKALCRPNTLWKKEAIDAL